MVPSRPGPRSRASGARLGAAALLCSFASIGVPPARVEAQTIEDGVFMSKATLCAGFVYGRDQWTDYWEGTLKRSNGNIGTVTTQSVALMGTYGITDRLNVIAMAPYIHTKPSAGTLRAASGVQDITLAVKYRVLQTPFTEAGSMRAVVAGSVGTPMTDYTSDYLPFSIGAACRRAAGRFTLNFNAKSGWYLTGTAGYAWRGRVTLDRSAYFTDGRLYLTDQVALPDVFDYTVTAGFFRNDLRIPVSFSQQRTRGGGDIRRQDMPFISNRMDFSRIDAFAQYYLPRKKDLSVKLGGSYVVDGRNVGQATSLNAGVLYTFTFSKDNR